jgi:hypothetical protein
LIELPEPGRLRGSTLARVLRVVAHGGITVNPYRVTRDAIRRLRGDYQKPAEPLGGPTE